MFGGTGRSTSFSFGGTSSAPTSGVGAPSSTPTLPQAPTFGFGGNNNTQQGQSSQQGAAGSSFSFGQQPNQGQNQQQPGSSTNSGLFGRSAAPAGISSGLFGQSQSGPQTNQMGASVGQIQPQQQSQNNNFGGSLFGANTSQQNQQGGSSLFGSTQQKPTFSFGAPQQQQQQQQQNQPSLGFGQSTNTGGMFGQSQGGQQIGQQNLLASQATPSVQINPSSPFARQAYHQKERFNDLPEDHKKMFEELDSHINGQLRIKDELGSQDHGNDIRKRVSEWNELNRALGNTLLVLQQDDELIKNIVDKVEHDRTDFVTMLEIAKSFKEGKSDGKQWVSWPGEFFTNAATQFRERITRYHTTIEEIEKQLSTIDTSNDHSPQLISDAILHQHSIFMALASNVAGLHSEVDQLRTEYTQWYQQRYRSVQNPFAMSQLTSTL